MLTRRFEDAARYALQVHAGHVRKGTQIPYVSHVFAVSGLVLEAGGNEDEAMAGLLHDAAEDGGGEKRLEDIRARFGNTVASIVKECSDSLAEDPKKKAPTEERKRKHLEDLRRDTSKSALLVTAADKAQMAAGEIPQRSEFFQALAKGLGQREKTALAERKKTASAAGTSHRA